MSDHTNSPWDALAARGAPRGADAVLTAAVTAAQSGSDGVPVAEMSERRPRPARRSRGRRTFGIIGIAALLGVGGYAIAGVQSNGTGADSPEAVVHQLADAIDHQDALAAVATLDPSEISTLQSSVSSAEHKAKQVKLVNSSDSPFAGINLSVDGLHTSVTTLADGVAKVTLSGSISASVDAGKLSEVLERVAGNAQGSVDLAQLGVHGGAPFVITVERDGKWYMSPAYTAFEYVRANQEPARGRLRFGRRVQARRRQRAGRGGTARARNRCRRLEHGRIARTARPIPALRIPRRVLAGDGTRHSAPVSCSRSTPSTPRRISTARTQPSTSPQAAHSRETIPRRAHPKLRGGNSSTVASTAAPTWSSTSTAGTGPVGSAMYISNLCLLGNGPLPIGSRAVTGGATHVGVVEEDGRWFVSPVGTALGYLDGWIANFDDNDLASLVHDPLLAPVTGSLTLDRRVKVSDSPGDLFALPEYAHYTLHVDAPTDVVVDTSDDLGQISGAYVPLPGDVYGTNIYGPNGKQLVPDSTYTRYHLAPGTYDVTTERSPYSTLTIWRAADAPKNVPTGEPGCEPTPDGGEECSSSDGVVQGGDHTGPGTPPVTVQTLPPGDSSKSSTRTTVTVP